MSRVSLGTEGAIARTGFSATARGRLDRLFGERRASFLQFGAVVIRTLVGFTIATDGISVHLLGGLRGRIDRWSGESILSFPQGTGETAAVRRGRGGRVCRGQQAVEGNRGNLHIGSPFEENGRARLNP